MSYDYRFKLIVIGETGTGKSCLVQQYTDDDYYFNNVHEVTIGVDFSTRITDITSKDKKYKIKTQLWDTAGQENFRSITSSYYRNTAAILLVFDLANRDSFLKLDYWLRQISIYAVHNPPVFLIGNKQDLFKRRVSSDEAFKYANSNNLKYIETSAKNKPSVDGLFYEVNKYILDNVLNTDDKIEGVFSDFKRDDTKDSLEDYNCRECCLVS